MISHMLKKIIYIKKYVKQKKIFLILFLMKATIKPQHRQFKKNSRIKLQIK